MGADGLTPGEAYAQVQAAVHTLVERQYDLLNEEILPRLHEQGIVLHHASEWNEAQQTWARETFTATSCRC